MSLEKVQQRYRELNGDDAMTADHEAYVRSWCVEPAGGAGLSRDEVLELMAAGRPPFAAYDNLRFGGPTSRQVWIDDVRRDHLT